ncbi:hypothetical protein P154DRAFT_622351 [Amniculicola lignicola CBS 123094]|uniref:Uncharacterized protein n=1 Tax=Amniculicola lignicola CBS 123094 TaxID=1392246 RepID=A0A6A5WBY8_9PLEO|nr:hypothetical protein P154DRAFT_622351 [Amniculicola lignicola CBS 123094]
MGFGLKAYIRKKGRREQQQQGEKHGEQQTGQQIGHLNTNVGSGNAGAGKSGGKGAGKGAGSAPLPRNGPAPVSDGVVGREGEGEGKREKEATPYPPIDLIVDLIVDLIDTMPKATESTAILQHQTNWENWFFLV